jgi:CPA2 family monovalent cation:H+ antiporter-2
MEDLDLILTLTGCLAAALVCGYVTFRLGLSPIVGYLLAGVVVGPTTPGFVANRHLAEQFAEVGVILLMFGVGLQFHVEELLAVRKVALPGAAFRSLGATVLGTLVGLGAGWAWGASLVYGLALSIASTVVLIRVLAENHDLQTRAGRLAVGWLVVEDLFTVMVLVLLPAALGTEVAGAGGVAMAIGLAIVKVAALIGLTSLAGERLIPWILGRVAATRSRELFTLTVLVLALGIAVGSARVFGISMALGAFLGGMVVGRSEFSLRAATDALPMRDAFAVLFFVSIGILFHPTFLLESPGLVAASLAIVLIFKPAATVAVTLFFGYPVRTGVSVAIASAQIGEFSFILAAAGTALGILDERATDALVAAGILSITINPIYYRLVDPLTSLLRRFVPPSRSEHGEAPADVTAETGGDRAIVVGYGPVGRTLTRLLRENKLEPVVIELNLETVRRLNGEGVRAIYGDAGHRETLVEAGVEAATALLLTSSGMTGVTETIRWARELNPAIRILARSVYLEEEAEYRRAGADLVFSGEGEVALAMTESLLRQLGATPEQIDRERDRVHGEYRGARGEIEPPAG